MKRIFNSLFTLTSLLTFCYLPLFAQNNASTPSTNGQLHVIDLLDADNEVFTYLQQNGIHTHDEQVALAEVIQHVVHEVQPDGTISSKAVIASTLAAQLLPIPSNSYYLDAINIHIRNIRLFTAAIEELKKRPEAKELVSDLHAIRAHVVDFLASVAISTAILNKDSTPTTGEKLTEFKEAMAELQRDFPYNFLTILASSQNTNTPVPPTLEQEGEASADTADAAESDEAPTKKNFRVVLNAPEVDYSMSPYAPFIDNDFLKVKMRYLLLEIEMLRIENIIGAPFDDEKVKKHIDGIINDISQHPHLRTVLVIAALADLAQEYSSHAPTPTLQERQEIFTYVSSKIQTYLSALMSDIRNGNAESRLLIGVKASTDSRKKITLWKKIGTFVREAVFFPIATVAAQQGDVAKIRDLLTLMRVIPLSRNYITKLSSLLQSHHLEGELAQDLEKIARVYNGRFRGGVRSPLVVSANRTQNQASHQLAEASPDNEAVDFKVLGESYSRSSGLERVSLLAEVLKHLAHGQLSNDDFKILMDALYSTGHEGNELLIPVIVEGLANAYEERLINNFDPEIKVSALQHLAQLSGQFLPNTHEYQVITGSIVDIAQLTAEVLSTSQIPLPGTHCKRKFLMPRRW